MLNHHLSLSLCLVLPGVQLRNKLNQDQNSKLQQQRENLNKRNLEVASMDKRISELRDRLWKKKAALQQKENLPVSIVLPQHKTTTQLHLLSIVTFFSQFVRLLLYYICQEVMEMVLIRAPPSGIVIKAICISLLL